MHRMFAVYFRGNDTLVFVAEAVCYSDAVDAAARVLGTHGLILEDWAIDCYGHEVTHGRRCGGWITEYVVDRRDLGAVTPAKPGPWSPASEAAAVAR